MCVKMAASCGRAKMAASCGRVKMAASCGRSKMAATCGRAKMAASVGVSRWLLGLEVLEHKGKMAAQTMCWSVDMWNVIRVL